MIDCVVRRVDLKEKLAFFIEFLSGNEIMPKNKKKINLDTGAEREKLDDLITRSTKEREKNAIKVTSE